MAENSTPTIAARLSVRGTEQVKGAFGEIRRQGLQTFGALRRQSRGMTDSVNNATRNAGAAATRTIGTAQVGLGTIGVTMLGLAGTAGTITGIVGEIGKKIIETAAALSAIGGGAAALIGTWATAQTKANEETLRQAAALGTSVEALSSWQSAIRLSGGQAESVTDIFGTLSEQMIEIRKGTDGADDAFRQLGIDVRKSNGDFKAADQLFADSLDSLSKIKDQGLRASAAYDVFGGSAKDLIPILSKGSAGFDQLRKDAARYGTTLSTTQAEAASDLMDQQRGMMESLRGTSMLAAEIVMPFVADAMEALGEWLVTNRTRVAKFVEDVIAYLIRVRNDVVALLSGKNMDVELGWVRALIGPFQWLQGIVQDIADALSGSNRRTWLTSMGNAARELFLVLGSVLGVLMGIDGANMAGLFDLANVFDAAAMAFQSFRTGIEGGVPALPWVGEMGRGFLELARSVGAVGNVIFEHRETIGDFATGTLYLLADGLAAVRQLLRGGDVESGNMFEWVNSAKAVWTDNIDAVKTVVQSLWDLLAGGVRIIQDVIGYISKIGEAMNLDPGQQALFVLLLTQIGTVVTAIGGVFGLIGKFAGGVKTVFGAIAFVAKDIAFVIAGIAAALGAPVWVVALIAAAIVAAGAAIYFFWDEIVAFLGSAWQGLVDAWNGAVDRIGEKFNKIGDGARQAWEAVVSAWNGAGEWFGNVAAGIGDTWNNFWSGVGSNAQGAWESVTTIFGGIVDFFAAPIKKIQGMWDGLWDGIKNGAKGAWDWVSGWFGGGGDAPAADGSLPSYDGGTSRVPGADGAPMTATIHGGERIWTVEQNKAFGALLDTLESHTTLPETEFSQAPVAPARQRSSSSDLHPMPVTVDGRRLTGLAGKSSAINQLRSAIRRGRRAMIAPQPRWA